MKKALLKNMIFLVTAITIVVTPTFSSTGVLKIKISSINYSDETAIRFMQGATTGFDGCCDAWKLFSPNYIVPNIYTKTPSLGNLSINSYPDLTSSVKMNLFLRIGAAATYTFEPTELEAFSSDVKIIMKDLTTGILYDIRTETPFTISLPIISQTDSARFQILFSAPTDTTIVPTEIKSVKKEKKTKSKRALLENDAEVNKNINIFPNPATSYCMVEIKGDVGTEAAIKVLDMMGRVCYSHTFILETSSTAILLDLKNNYHSGTYAICINTKENFYTKKIMIQNN